MRKKDARPLRNKFKFKKKQNIQNHVKNIN